MRGMAHSLQRIEDTTMTRTTSTMMKNLEGLGNTDLAETETVITIDLARRTMNPDMSTYVHGPVA